MHIYTQFWAQADVDVGRRRHFRGRASAMEHAVGAACSGDPGDAQWAVATVTPQIFEA